jgi:hypothetical protein
MGHGITQVAAADKKSGEGFYKWNEQETGQTAYTI